MSLESIVKSKARFDEEFSLYLLDVEEEKKIAKMLDVSVHVIHKIALENNILPSRYMRNLGTLGVEGQRKLLHAKVGIFGLGGLGGWAAEYLARYGVGCLVLVDFDYYSDNNLNRQTFCTIENLGERKALETEKRIKIINNATEIIAHKERIIPENIEKLMEGCDVIVDALDNVKTRLLLQKASSSTGIPFVHGAIAGPLGQVMTVFPEDKGLESIYGSENIDGVEKKFGNPVTTPAMIAVWQVQEVVKLLLGQEGLLRNKLLLVDCQNGTVEKVSLSNS